MTAAIDQAPLLDDLLRQFHGAQGVVFLFLCLFVVALILAALLSTRPYVIVMHTDEDEQERRASLDAAFKAAHPKYMNPFLEHRRPLTAAIARPMEPAVQQPPAPASFRGANR